MGKMHSFLIEGTHAPFYHLLCMYVTVSHYCHILYFSI